MRRLTLLMAMLFCTTITFSSGTLGIIIDEELLEVGVKPENIKQAKEMVDKVTVNYKMLVLEKKQLELEVNKIILEGPEENLEKIDNLFDRIGQLEAAILKNKIRSQIEIQKYITQEQYIRARELAIKRLNNQQ